MHNVSDGWASAEAFLDLRAKRTLALGFRAGSRGEGRDSRAARLVELGVPGPGDDTHAAVAGLLEDLAGRIDRADHGNIHGHE